MIVILFILNLYNIAFIRQSYFEDFFDCKFLVEAFLTEVVDLWVVVVDARLMVPIHDLIKCSRYAAMLFKK